MLLVAVLLVAGLVFALLVVASVVLVAIVVVLVVVIPGGLTAPYGRVELFPFLHYKGGWQELRPVE